MLPKDTVSGRCEGHSLLRSTPYLRPVQVSPPSRVRDPHLHDLLSKSRAAQVSVAENRFLRVT